MTKFIAGVRNEFAGTLRQHGTRLKQNLLAERWILLVDVVRSDTGESIAKRIWFRDGAWSRDMNKGHRYAFHARTEPCRSEQYEPGMSGRINQEWRIVNPNKVREVAISQKTKTLDWEETHASKVHSKRRNKPRRKGRSNTILSIFDNRRETGPGRARHWTG